MEINFFKPNECLPKTHFCIADAESVKDEGGELKLVNPYTLHESKPCLIIGTPKDEYVREEKQLAVAVYSIWNFYGGEVATAWLDYLTGDIEFDVEAWAPLSAVFNDETVSS